MSKTYRVLVEISLEVTIHDDDLSIADYIDEMYYDFQTCEDHNADIQNTELTAYNVIEEFEVVANDLAFRYIHRMEDDNE